MSSIRVALAGVGNVASALVQGVEMYRRSDCRLGLLPEIDQYSVTDLEFVVAFDVNANKVGRDLSEAIFVEPNNTVGVFEPPELGAPVLKGPVLDGLDSRIREFVPVDESQRAADVAGELRRRGADVLVITIPTGSQRAAEFYANAALDAGCAVFNGMPALVANDPTISAKAERLGLPVVGDDVKSQVGATIVHRSLANIFPSRGAVLDRTIQLDWGGDMDFCNLLSNGRYEMGKRQSKTESVIARLPNRDDVEVQISAVDYIPFLANQKEAYFRLEGRIFGGVPVRIDVTMQVIDGYNSAGIIVDGVRVLKIALDGGVGGVLHPACSFFNKRPPEQLDDVVARERLVEFIRGERPRGG
ncbi:MAG: inositol-3-phosphate synthase [Promethearchaeota archaeon]